MPNTREKLIELLCQAHNLATYASAFGFGDISDAQQLEMEADRLIANGVTFQNRDCHWATERAYKNGLEAGKPKWIPVTERLPEDASTVLAVDGDGTICTAYYVGRWHGGGDLDEDAVTYWMPLPEPPKGE